MQEKEGKPRGNRGTGGGGGGYILRRRSVEKGGKRRRVGALNDEAMSRVGESSGEKEFIESESRRRRGSLSNRGARGGAKGGKVESAPNEEEREGKSSRQGVGG